MINFWEEEEKTGLIAFYKKKSLNKRQRMLRINILYNFHRCQRKYIILIVGQRTHNSKGPNKSKAQPAIHVLGDFNNRKINLETCLSDRNSQSLIDIHIL